MATRKPKASGGAAKGVAPKRVFSLDQYKKDKKLEGVKFKDQEWLFLSPAFQETTGLPGFPCGHLTVLRGHTDTGKTTALLEGAITAQKMGKLPVFIISELKFSWDHAKLMGLEFEEVVDEETGEVIDYKGNFIYRDRGHLKSIEGMGEFIMECIEDQKKGNLPVDLVFFIDSIGTIPCNLSLESKKSNNEWDAGAYSRVFGKMVIPEINMSRKEGTEFTNTLVAITQVWTKKPDSPVGMPKLACKGGDTIPFNCSLMITFGNVTNPGTSKLKARKNNKEITYATRTKIAIEKNHINGVSTSGRIIAAPHCYLMDSEKDKVAKEYFKEYGDYFMSQLGDGDGEIMFFEEEVNDVVDVRNKEENTEE